MKLPLNLPLRKMAVIGWASTNFNRMKNMEFTHYWVSGFGWENTIYQPEDFVTVEEMGFNDIDGHIFLGINEKGGKHILKGVYVS